MIEEAFAEFVSTLVDAFNMPAPRRVVIWAGIIIAVMICAFGLVVFTTRANAMDKRESVNDPAKPKVHYRVRLLDHWADVPDSFGHITSTAICRFDVSCPGA